MSNRAFTVQDLVACYRSGVFPMAESRGDARTFLVDPPMRGILPLDAFHVPRRLCRTVRSDRLTVRIDTAFAEVVAACAAPGNGRLNTWINAPIERLCGELFALGLAHSVEAWREGRLVGGLYGVALGAAFFGESMFSRERDTSKVCLIHLVARLRVGGYSLLDAQFLTDHLAKFGAVEVPRAAYRQRLTRSVGAQANFWALDPYATGATALQAISQAS